MRLPLKRDGVCNPVTHILTAIKAFKRFLLLPETIHTYGLILPEHNC